MLLSSKYLKTGKLLLVVYLFLFKNILLCQNLIINSSFERVDTPVCWNSGGFVNNCSFPSKRNVTNWDSYNTPDYYTTNPNAANVPHNSFGVSYAKHGTSYGGIVVFYETTSFDIKEYVSQYLTNALIADSVYCMSFFISLADRSEFAIKNIGAFFSINSPTLINGYYIDATPQIINASEFITDTINWTEIQGCFTAQGGEQYVTIGNFNSNINTDTLHQATTNPFPVGTTKFSYYYIDSVSLWKNNFPTSIKEQSNEGMMKVYPNPCNEILNVECKIINDKTVLKIIVSDILGRKIMESDYKEQIDISGLEKGIYFVAIVQGSKTLGVKKIIKQ